VAKEAYEAVLLGLTEDGTLNLLDMRDHVEEIKKEMGVKNDIVASELLDFHLLREVAKEMRM
jgi:hypothetical protein